MAGVTLVVLGIADGDLHFGSHWHNFAGGFARVTYSFGMGVLIYRTASSGIAVKLPPALILVACGTLFVVEPGAYMALYEITCVLINLPALVVLGASTEPTARMRSLFSFLGLISYGAYSLHFPLALLMKGVLQKLAGDRMEALTPWTGFALLAGLVFVCWLVDKAYDTPVRRYLTGLTKARRQTAASREG